ncbi:MAG TPA: hypothetical protein VLB67_00515 [Acidimicrobiia bacterium]|nr:hypothetical protein [Acidimicrobiia bacterium]
MAWFWTDDLARVLLSAGADESSLSELLTRPSAVSAADEVAALEVARRMAGIPRRETDAA